MKSSVRSPKYDGKEQRNKDAERWYEASLRQEHGFDSQTKEMDAIEIQVLFRPLKHSTVQWTMPLRLGPAVGGSVKTSNKGTPTNAGNQVAIDTGDAGR